MKVYDLPADLREVIDEGARALRVSREAYIERVLRNQLLPQTAGGLISDPWAKGARPNGNQQGTRDQETSQ